MFLDRLQVKRYGAIGAILLTVGGGAFAIFRDFVFPWYLQHENDGRHAAQPANEDGRWIERIKQEDEDRRNREAAESEKIRLLKELLEATRQQANTEAVEQIASLPNRPATEATKTVPPQDPAPAKRIGTEETTAVEDSQDSVDAQAAEVGLRSFSVIGDNKFDLCGYSGFSVSARAGEATLHSTDRRIPDRPFSGWSTTVPLGERAEIVGGCKAIVSANKAAGIDYYVISEIESGR